MRAETTDSRLRLNRRIKSQLIERRAQLIVYKEHRLNIELKKYKENKKILPQINKFSPIKSQRLKRTALQISEKLMVNEFNNDKSRELLLSRGSLQGVVPLFSLRLRSRASSRSSLSCQHQSRRYLKLRLIQDPYSLFQRTIKLQHKKRVSK